MPSSLVTSPSSLTPDIASEGVAAALFCPAGAASGVGANAEAITAQPTLGGVGGMVGPATVEPGLRPSTD